MSTTTRARNLFSNRRIAAKWVLARLYIARRGLRPYRYMGAVYRQAEEACHAFNAAQNHHKN